MFIADLHIHSRFSRATSRELDAPTLDMWARRKGIALIGTGDFTHPAWREELSQMLVPDGSGFYTLAPGFAKGGLPGKTHFVITGEISSIYKKNGKTRKVHNLIILPSLDAADELSRRLEAVGNIRSDGRPILGLDSRDLLEMTLGACPDAIFVPAHIWTPHFSLFGAFSGFDTIEECFGDLTGEIHALETGLSSDPPMNRRVSALDKYNLISNSDAHSPSKLGREATLFSCDMTFSGLSRAIATGEGLSGTVEFFPEEGKYHLDGHRNCHFCLTPGETERLGGICPVCGKKITIGVEHRVCQLADRPQGYEAPGAKPFLSLMPLNEVVASSTGFSVASKRTVEIYDRLTTELGSEFHILRDVSPDDVERVAGPLTAEGLRRLRRGDVTRKAGFDGEYGSITLLTPAEREEIAGQMSLLFGISASAPAKQKPELIIKESRIDDADAGESGLNEAQLRAVMAESPVTIVTAGPGTGKTKTLTERIARLIETGRAKPQEITAVTFTRKAAAEMGERLDKRLGGAARGVTIGTFHAVCLSLLDKKPVIGEREATEIIRRIAKARGSTLTSAKAELRQFADGGEPSAIVSDYIRQLEKDGVRDMDGVLRDALAVDVSGRRMFNNLFVDEFQDINRLQRELTLHWARGRLFLIGDPDQSIYGFRGASANCFSGFPGAERISLSLNYRSSAAIVAAATAVIEHNGGAARGAVAVRGKGVPVRLVHTADAFSEGIYIAKEIAGMAGGIDMLTSAARRDMRAFSDIAVLCRTNRQLELVESCLRHDSIPCAIFGRGSHFDDDRVRRTVAFFSFLTDSGNGAALFDYLVASGFADEEKALLCSSAFPVYKAAGDIPSALEASGCPARAAAEIALFSSKRGKPWKLIEEYAKEAGIECDAVKRLADTAVFHQSMESLLSSVTIGEEGDIMRADAKEYDSGAVRLMTIHGSKGLEFPVVFLAGLSEGIMPYVREGEATDVEEERRLLFVAMTRAQDELIITSPAPPSPFEAELISDVVREKATMRRSVTQLSIF